MAIMLGKRFGTSAEFWLNLQMMHELEEARRTGRFQSERRCFNRNQWAGQTRRPAQNLPVVLPASVPHGTQQRHLRLAEFLVQIDVVLRHAPRGEAAVEGAADHRPVEFVQPVHGGDRGRLIVHDEAG